MFRQMHEENFKIVLHVVSCPEDLHGEVGDTGAALANQSSAAVYWQNHREVSSKGVDGWWPDEGDELPPSSRLARNRMYWEGSQAFKPNVRPIALHRNGYAGMQRYSWLWSGDTLSTWKTLAAQVNGGDHRWTLRHSVLGYRHRRLCADEGVYGGAVCAMVSVQLVLSVVSLPWTNMDAATTVGMGYGKLWTGRVRWPVCGAYIADAKRII